MILCAAPVLAIATLFGGIDPVGLLGALLVVLSCGLFGCSLALTLSVWGRKTHEVLMATYVFGILYLLSAPILAGVQSGLPSRWWPSWFPTFRDMLQYNPIFLVLAATEGPPPAGGGRVSVDAAARMDAMISDRVYRKALSIKHAQEEIQRCSGTQFDPKVVEVFIKMHSTLWTELRENIGKPYRLSQLKAV
jgi:hypothetical protein